MVGFYSTEARPSARVTLKLKDQLLLNETVAISPGHSFVKDSQSTRRSGRT